MVDPDPGLAAPAAVAEASAEEPLAVPLPPLPPPSDRDPHDLCAAALLGLTLGKCSQVSPSSTIAFVFESTPLDGRDSAESVVEPWISAWLISFKHYAQLWAVRADVTKGGDGADELGCRSGG